MVLFDRKKCQETWDDAEGIEPAQMERLLKRLKELRPKSIDITVAI